MKIFAQTDRGRVRPSNQDAFSFAKIGEDAFVVVCDGMGGARGGNVASRVAADGILQGVKEQLLGVSDLKEARVIIRRAMREVNAALYRMASDDPSLCGMGTTVVGAFVCRDSALVMNIGDSRAYSIGAEAITQITRDHSVVEEMIRSGQITREEGQSHPSRHIITMALGPEEDILPDFYECPIKGDDMLLLCSDGLSNMLSDDEIFEIVTGLSDKERVPATLIDAANEKGGADNITAVLCVPGNSLKEEGAV